ncbi:MAG: class I SAM-dependent methyltransferase [Candidatus Omnitrophota bacterium]
MNCRLCASGGVRELFLAQDIHGRHILSEDKFAILQCEACGVTFTEVETDSDYYKKYYRENYYPPINSNSFIDRILSWMQNFSFKQRLKLIETYKSSQGNRVLEIGCGRGEFLNFLPDVYEKNGVEINEKGYNFVKENYKNIDVHNLRINDRTFEASILGKFDVIIMWHVFEHINDPVIFAENLAKLLAENGVIIFDIPNRNSFGFSWCKKWWFHLDAPRHLFHYDYNSMRDLIKRSKLEIIEFLGNFRDYPQDLPASFYSRFKTNNFISNLFLFIFVLPIATIFRLIIALFLPKRAEINTYIVKHYKG